MKNRTDGLRNVEFSSTIFLSLASADLADWFGDLSPAKKQSAYSHYLAQVEAFTKKNTSVPGNTPASRKEKALELFSSYETWCGQVNRCYPIWGDNFSPAVRTCLDAARNIIADIMGEDASRALPSVLEMASFGSGMTVGDGSRSDASLIKKISNAQTVTADCLPYIRPLLAANPGFTRWLKEVKVVRGNRVTTVPKTASVDRTIAIEPSINILIQKGVDYYLKKRLASHGVDLHDQSLGWPLAKQGSVDGSYATIDLSGASDCVSMAILEDLLPNTWVGLLDDIRSKEYSLGGQWHRYEKFASMGNASTFPVESIIFYGVARACTDFCGGGEVIVYGDDIIVPGNAFLLTMEVLGSIGFFPNPDKSFGTHGFRETCGRDYQYGVDVRPTYIYQWPRKEHQVYNLYNRLLCNRQGVKYFRTLEYLFHLVPRPCLTPRYLGASEDWMSWEKFKAVEYGSGFMVPGFWPGLSDRRRFDAGIQSAVYVVRQVQQKQGAFRYEGPLLLELALYTGSSRPVDIGKTRHFVKKKRVTTFPSEGWWPGFLYPGA